MVIQPMNKVTRSYLREFGGAMVAYVVVLPASLNIIQAHAQAPWRFAVALAPVIPAAFALWAVIRHVRRIDELQRQIQFEALVFSFSVVALLTFSYGFLENVGVPRLSYIYVLPLMVALWGIGVAFATRKYQ